MKNLYLLLVLVAPFTFAETLSFRTPTPRETEEFQAYFTKSGLLRKNHTITALKPGPAFQIIPGACADGDDLYTLSFDGGIELRFPKKESMAQFYPMGTGGAWTPIFRRDPRTQYFQFLGGSTHHSVRRVLPRKGQCPDLEVSVHGSYCGKAGSEDCRGKLIYSQQEGYREELPFLDEKLEVVNQLRPEVHGSPANIQCPIMVDPGQSFGKINLGMSREEVAKLGMVRKNLTSKNDQIVGMFTVQYDEEGKVIDIGAEVKDLPDCLYFGKTKLNRELGGVGLSKQFKGCKAEDIRKGGNTINCPFMWIQEGGWGGKQKSPVIRVHSAQYGSRF